MKQKILTNEYTDGIPDATYYLDKMNSDYLRNLDGQLSHEIKDTFIKNLEYYRAEIGGYKLSIVACEVGLPIFKTYQGFPDLHNLNKYISDEKNKYKPSWFGTELTAYSIASQNWFGTIAYKTTKKIYLLDMSNYKNYPFLLSLLSSRDAETFRYLMGYKINHEEQIKHIAKLNPHWETISEFTEYKRPKRTAIYSPKKYKHLNPVFIPQTYKVLKLLFSKLAKSVNLSGWFYPSMISSLGINGAGIGEEIVLSGGAMKNLEYDIEHPINWFNLNHPSFTHNVELNLPIMYPESIDHKPLNYMFKAMHYHYGENKINIDTENIVIVDANYGMPLVKYTNIKSDINQFIKNSKADLIIVFRPYLFPKYIDRKTYKIGRAVILSNVKLQIKKDRFKYKNKLIDINKAYIGKKASDVIIKFDEKTYYKLKQHAHLDYPSRKKVFIHSKLDLKIRSPGYKLTAAPIIFVDIPQPEG